uniref:ATP synthase complex subunit 8 n=1 Tax=Polydactylus sextarius TaxID=435218 RepID=A0A0U1ZWT2_9TELE|nr:ATP synthase F0 subunit 8 [Polydactylus sextarius]AKE49774.1 ATP synthase F0 subunit 8 [Polydactylus sextarius]UAD89985.1 ATP synthase F0 subunit 8 [Polydactylus sextarius]
MPQLNPAPWFQIFILSWFTLLLVVFPKILNYTYPNEPTVRNTEAAKQGHWLWPWH